MIRSIANLFAFNLVVNRGGRPILNRVSAAFETASLTAVIGPNGAGKSTLLAALAGLIKPDSGTVVLEDRPLPAWDRRALARRRAYLPQSPRAEWPIPVERLVALGLTPHLPAFGPLPPELKARVDAILRDCDLAAQAQQPATTLSGGEFSRAMLARALVGDPQVLIVDEPMTGLDPRNAMDAMAHLADLATGGKLLVVAVHDLTLAARFSNHILALRDGVVVADGPTEKTLTPDMLRRVFDVEARIVGTGREAVVDFVAPPPMLGPAA